MLNVFLYSIILFIAAILAFRAWESIPLEDFYEDHDEELMRDLERNRKNPDGSR